MKTTGGLMQPSQGIRCVHLVMVLWISSLVQGTTASIQVRRFMATKGLTSSPDAPVKLAKQQSHAEPTSDDWSNSVGIPAQIPKINRSHIPHLIHQLVGVVWVLLLGSTPILIYKMDHRPVTKTGIAVSSVMWVTLFGGLYLFTNVILFQSAHFDQVRSLTIIECCYFMTQVITTVGYGDMTPAYPRGQLFVGLYVVLAFFVIALLLSEMQSLVVSRVSVYKEMLERKTGMHSSASRANVLHFKPGQPSPLEFLATVAVFITVAIAWILFFHFYPGENKTWLEATYMALITLTTVGFGAVTPVTEGGMLFGAFFMFLGTASLVGVVTSFSSYVLEMSQWESWDPKQFHDDLINLTVKVGTEISELDFVTFTLVQKNILSKEQMDAIKDAYVAMKKVTKKGSVTLKHVKKFAEVNEAQAASDTE